MNKLFLLDECGHREDGDSQFEIVPGTVFIPRTNMAISVTRVSFLTALNRDLL